MKQFECVEDWVNRPHMISFNFGPLVLGKVHLATLARDYAGQPFDDSPRLLLESAGKSVRALHVMGEPIEANQARISIRDTYIRYIVSPNIRSYVDLEGTFLDYIKKLSAKTRAGTGRSVRNFLKINGDLPSFREFRRPEDITEFHQLACKVSSQTYQS